MMDAQKVRQRVVQEALAWLGTPYRHCADVKGQGVDCAMFLVRVYRAVGLIPDIDPRPYSPEWHLHRSEEKYLGWLDQYADCAPDSTAPQPGDVCVWRFGRTFSHGGIVVPGDEFVHALMGVGVIQSSLNNSEWAQRPRRCYVIKGLSDGR